MITGLRIAVKQTTPERVPHFFGNQADILSFSPRVSPASCPCPEGLQGIRFRRCRLAPTRMHGEPTRPVRPLLRRPGPIRRIKSVLRMELLLNLAWLLLAAVLVSIWLQRDSRAGTGGVRQVIAIAVLIAILFPAISMSDDLLAVQNPFEADTCQRRDHLEACAHHPVQPTLTMLAAVLFADAPFRFTRFAVPRLVPLSRREQSDLAVKGNRPPPAA